MHLTTALLFAAAAQALQVNHIFRRPTPFLNEKNTFTEDDGYKLLEGHREKRFTVAWARDLLRPPKPGKLVLVRHGESTWNRNATFTGWTDVDLSERGEREVEHASRLLLVLTQRLKLRRWRRRDAAPPRRRRRRRQRVHTWWFRDGVRATQEAGISVDVCYTSRLRRAIRSSWILLKGLDAVYRPVFKSWRLNERHYGSCSVLELRLSRRRRHGATRRRPHGPQQASIGRGARRGARASVAPWAARPAAAHALESSPRCVWR